MKNIAAILCVLFSALGVAHASATTNPDLYSESITSQLSSAEVPKSFESNARVSGSAMAAVTETAVVSPSADATMEPVESVDQLDQADVAAKTKKKSKKSTHTN